ncbi:hypothetical protein HNQ77_004327 [Silvibacterium bohemicum]|uniref:YtkA-like domain-containing protein n=2 Tax=Silvibacterium bohemicum TaxID=1577686 RepID=A0A841K079_9BACT|nr:hypothetical protein [Silvibacterium bohemicum]
MVNASLLLLAEALAMTACHRTRPIDDAGISIQQRITPQPPRVGPASVAIQLSDAAARPVEAVRITVEADMSHPGMSPVFAEARKEKPGDYLATLNLNMGGDWVVLTHVELPGGKKLERQMDLRGVASR